MARAASKDVIRLSRRRRRKLERITRMQTAPQREVRRAQIVLLAAARVPNAAIARQLGCHADTVRATRRRYLAEGMRAMKDRHRSGRALVYDIDARLLVIATATSEPAGPETAWTHAGIAAHLAAEHQIPISASQAGRILAEADIKPHLVRGWLLQRRLLRRGEFTSRAQLAGKILEFICNYDDKARPFRWSYDGRPLKAA